jgi:hypothetical protein
MEELTEPLDVFRALTTGSVQAPPDARSAKARVVVRPRGEQQGTVFVDDAWFVASDPAPPAAEAEATAPSDDPDGPVSRARSGEGSRAASSAVASAARLVDLAPRPSPVVQRADRSVEESVAESDGESDALQRWALPIAAAVAIGASGWAALWWQRRRTS